MFSISSTPTLNKRTLTIRKFFRRLPLVNEPELICANEISFKLISLEKV